MAIRKTEVRVFQTPQENFWAGEFGDAYIQRNQGAALLATKTALFARLVCRLRRAESIIEFGANIGLNLKALHGLLPQASLSAIEINPNAVDALRAWGECEVLAGSILDVEPLRSYDLAFTSGVLIHINPEALPIVYEKLYRASHKYLCIIEYYNPSPVVIPYRGHNDRLFKRDFAGEILDTYPDLQLIDYGFVYHRDPNFPQDDLTWFLLEKYS